MALKVRPSDWNCDSLCMRNFSHQTLTLALASTVASPPNWIWTFTIATRDWKLAERYLSSRSKSKVFEYFNNKNIYRNLSRTTARGSQRLYGWHFNETNMYGALIKVQSSWSFFSQQAETFSQQTLGRMFAETTIAAWDSLPKQFWQSAV